ncbi:MAG: sulfotransferase domain-containing protein [Promethearchaeota archaeon]
MLPNFLGVGAQKAGTTTLYDLLKQHPNIYLPRRKEIHFFDKESNYKKGISWYENEFFSEVKGQKAIGEITPIYMYLDCVPKRIYESLGKEVKLIFILRNPIDRAYSHYWMSFSRGYEKETFENAIELEKERLKRGPFEKSHFSYIDRGFYSKQIKRYLKYFSKENMLFIIFEQFIRNIPDTLYRVYNFLEVEPNINFDYNKKSNPASIPRSSLINNAIHGSSSLKEIIKYFFPDKKARLFLARIIDKINKTQLKKPQMKFRTKKLLIEKYKNEIKELEKIIEKDLSFWTEG